MDVAKTGSFTLASARLFQTQSTLTVTIQFKEEIGLKFFEQSVRLQSLIIVQVDSLKEVRLLF
jgi:DNA-binding transcriptional LysR family regulator